MGAKVQAFEPEAIAERIYGERDDLMQVDDQIQAVIEADALVIYTEWKEFCSVNFAWLVDPLAEKVVIDGRNLYTPSAVEEAGLRYVGGGRKSNS